jgi:hypothetical protein
LFYLDPINPLGFYRVGWMRAAVQSQRGGDVESYQPRRGFAMGFQKGQPVNTGQNSLFLR